jgi:hypothetical protein
VLSAGTSPELVVPALAVIGEGISKVIFVEFPAKVIALPVEDSRNWTLVRVPGLPEV